MEIQIENLRAKMRGVQLNNYQRALVLDEYHKLLDYVEKLEQLYIPAVSGCSIKIPKPTLKFEGLDNISIVGEKDILLSELFELHLKLEKYLKSRPEAIINESGLIVGFKN